MPVADSASETRIKVRAASGATSFGHTFYESIRNSAHPTATLFHSFSLPILQMAEVLKRQPPSQAAGEAHAGGETARETPAAPRQQRPQPASHGPGKDVTMNGTSAEASNARPEPSVNGRSAGPKDGAAGVAAGTVKGNERPASVAAPKTSGGSVWGGNGPTFAQIAKTAKSDEANAGKPAAQGEATG